MERNMYNKNKKNYDMDSLFMYIIQKCITKTFKWTIHAFTVKKKTLENYAK